MGLLTLAQALRARDSNGDPVAGARLYLFTSGTSRLVPVYADSQLTDMVANPLRADDQGYFAKCYLKEGDYSVAILTPRKERLFEQDGVRVAAEVTDDHVRQTFATVADLLSDEALTYADTAPDTRLIVSAEGWNYIVLPADSGEADLSTAGGLKLCVQAHRGGYHASQFGAVNAGDGTVALQGALDRAIHAEGQPENAPGGPVVADAKHLGLTKTLHLGYGDSFRSGTFAGLGKAYAGSDAFAGTTLKSTVTDAPTVSIQGARGTRIRDLTLEGAARGNILGLFATESNGSRDFLDRGHWEAALTASGMSFGGRRTPVTGICIDAYSGAAPAPKYPDVDYPDFLGVQAQYDKAFSSDVTAENMEISGFEVGAVIQPNVSGNGDFVAFRDLDISYCVDGISVGSTQARSTDLSGCTFARVHTLITNRRHGDQAGRFDATYLNGHVGGFATQIFDLGAGSTGGTLSIQNFYAESLARLGTIEASNAIPYNGVVLRDCKFDLNSVASDQFVESALIKGSWSDQVVVEGCNFRTRSVVSFGQGPVLLSNNLNTPDAPTQAYQALALNCLSGGFVPDPIRNPAFTARMAAWRASAPGGTAGTGLSDASFGLTGRDTCIPHAMTRGRCASGGTFFDKQMPVGYVSSSKLSFVTRVDRTVSAVHANLTTGDSDRAYRYGALPGSVWVHRETGTVLFVRSADSLTGETILEMQNNYYFDGSNWQILDTGYDPATAEYYTFNGLVFAPEYALFGDLTAGSNVITNVHDTDGAANVADWGLMVGDRLGDGYYPAPLAFGTNRLAITGIDTGAGTITLQGNLAYTGRLVLPFWFRAPPANASTR